MPLSIRIGLSHVRAGSRELRVVGKPLCVLRRSRALRGSFAALATFGALKATYADPALGGSTPRGPSQEVAEVIVEGLPPRRVGPGAKDETLAATVVRKEALQQAGAGLNDALRGQPGLQLTSAGATSELTTVLVRGATSAQLPVYLAGVRINDDITGAADLSTVPTWLLNRVEVYRGNAPLEADRMSLGGAVFLEPRMPSKTRAAAAAGVGSYGWHSVSVFGGVGGSSASSLVSLRLEQATNDYPYTDDHGTRFNTADDTIVRRKNADASAADLWAISRVEHRGVRWTAVLNQFVREQGAPGLALAPALAARVRTERSLLATQAQVPCGERCSAEITVASLRSFQVIRDPREELVFGASQLALTGTRVEPSLRGHWVPIDPLSIGVATDVARESIVRREPAQVSTRATRDFARAAGQISVTPGPLWLVSALASMERSATETAAAPSSLAMPLNGRLSARLGDESLSLVSNVGQYARVPTLGELYGQSAFVRGNDALLAEHGTSVDAGIRGAKKFRLRDDVGVFAEMDLFGFARKAHELVAYERASFGYVRPYNVGSAQVVGLEAALVATLARLVRLEENLTLQDARDTTSGRVLVNDQLPFRSRFISSSAVTFLLGEAIGAKRAEAGARLIHQASRYADPAGLIVLPAQTSLDLELSVMLAMGPADVTWRGRVANATNAALFDTVGYPLPPRQFFATAEVSF